MANLNEGLYMEIDKKYYLETNALYSLINKVELFVDNCDVATSLYAYEELVEGIDEEEYHRRKVILNKLKGSKLKIYPYLPMECIAIAYGLDISQFPIVKRKKELLWAKVKLAIASDSYDEYAEKLNKIMDMKVVDEKAENDKHKKEVAEQISKLIQENHANIKNTRERQKKNPTYYQLDVNKMFVEEEPTHEIEKGMLIRFLDECKIEYEENDIDEIIQRYDGRQLVAFILGEQFYMWNRSYYMKLSGKNDLSDLTHLLYLKDENYVIVSDDKIFQHTTLSSMRMTCNDFLDLFKEK